MSEDAPIRPRRIGGFSPSSLTPRSQAYEDLGAVVFEPLERACPACGAKPGSFCTPLSMDDDVFGALAVRDDAILEQRFDLAVQVEKQAVHAERWKVTAVAVRGETLRPEHMVAALGAYRGR